MEVNEATYLIKASKLMEWRRYDEAIEEIKSYLRYDVQSDEAFSLLGNCWQNKNDLIKALSFYREALKIKPSNYNALINTAGIYLYTKQPDKFDPINQAALSYYPESSYIHAQRGVYYEMIGDVDAAQKSVDDALTRDPNSGYAHALSSSLAASRNDRKKSRYHEEKALASSPEDAFVKMILAGAAGARGDFQKSVQLAQQAVFQEPNPSYVRDFNMYRIISRWWYRWPYTFFNVQINLFYKKTWLFWVIAFILALMIKYLILLYATCMIGLPFLLDAIKTKYLNKLESGIRLKSALSRLKTGESE